MNQKPYTVISVRLDPELKQKYQQLCRDLGLTLSAGLKVQMTQAVKEGRIPVDLRAKP